MSKDLAKGFRYTLDTVGIIIILVLVSTCAYDQVSSDCRKSSDCTKGEYCGSDKSCHEVPKVEQNVQKTLTVQSNNYTAAGFIIGIALIISAIILRRVE